MLDLTVESYIILKKYDVFLLHNYLTLDNTGTAFLMK